jgi:TonB family protein
MAADLLRVVFWFNPLVWLLCARLRREAEYACDDVVLETGVPATAYASHLLEIARACRRPAPGWMPALSVARPSTLEGRVTAMLNARLNRQAPTWRAVAVILVLLAGIAIPIASFDVAAQGVGGGALTGYVYDPSGGVLPGVEVRLVDGREGKRSAVSDGTGKFSFTAVGAGEYTLEVTLPGFRPLEDEFTLATPKNWTRNITLQVGELQETIRVTGKRPAQPVAAGPAARNSGPVRVGGNIKQPAKTKTVNPIYPAAMQAAGIEGLVPIDAVIGVDGKVASVRVLSAQVHPELARAAEEAVRQWEFTPTLLNNVAVPVEMTVSISFTLED